MRNTLKKKQRAGLAWAVHLFTASGIVLGFLALVSVLRNDITQAFLWLGLALFVDGVDGSLARKARVNEYTPNVDGRTLDNVIDYFNYVAVPALMIYWFGMVPPPFGIAVAAAIMAVSTYTFANVGVKSDDYYFVGFPAVWNVAVLYFYLLDTNLWVNLAAIVVMGILTFVPMKFVHPLRVKSFAVVTVPITLLWGACTLLLLVGLMPDGMANVVTWIWVASSLYFAGLSIWRSLQAD